MKEISICTIILIWSNNILVITVHSTHCSPALLLHCTTLNDTSFPINFTLFHFNLVWFLSLLNFLQLHCTSHHHTSLYFTTLNFTSLYFTTLRCTSLLPDFRHTSVTFTPFIIASLTLFLKVLGYGVKFIFTVAYICRRENSCRYGFVTIDRCLTW
jgi:hypothetical protein